MPTLAQTLHARISISVLLILILLLTACAAPNERIAFPFLPTAAPEATTVPIPTAYPTRQPYLPGTLVDYTAQTGDSLPALAAHFNTTIAEIRSANPIIPQDATTMPPGMPMKIPIYYQSLWGSPFQILPDGHFINGPAQVGFNARIFVANQPGWFKNYSTYVGFKQRTGGEIVDYIATNFSISPRLLLAILEYQSGALSQPEQPAQGTDYPLGYFDSLYTGPEGQLIWASDLLNDAYYGWRIGTLNQFELLDGRLVVIDPWQNAASAALQAFYSRVLNADEYSLAISSEGLLKTYTALFGDPWSNPLDHIPGSLQQPAFTLPFPGGHRWAYTGGPHTGWGSGLPFSALDFAPPVKGCNPSEDWSTAVADGIISRVSPGSLVLDLDGDGDERTGWSVYYLHLATASMPAEGTAVKTGDLLGHPSCEGGRATGSHVHIARKYNGEWIPADGVLAFNMEGWLAYNGTVPYEGTLKRFGTTVTASAGGDAQSSITSDRR